MGRHPFFILAVLLLFQAPSYAQSGLRDTSLAMVPALDRWNLGVGFGLMLAGFFMTTRWR